MTMTTRRILQALGTASLVLALMPGYQARITTDDGGATTNRTSFRLGMPFSPIVSVERTWVETPTGTPGRSLPSFRQSAEVHILSLSCGLLVVGLVLVTWRDRRGATTAG